MSIMRCHRHDRSWDSDQYEECPSCMRDGFEPPSQNAIESMAQDLAALCEATHLELGNDELFITEDTATDWHVFFRDASRMHDRLAALRMRSLEPEPVEEPDYTGREYRPTSISVF